MNLLILLLSMIGWVLALSCYKWNEYDEKNLRTFDGMNYCTAFFDGGNKLGSFSGGKRDPTKKENLDWDDKIDKDCQIKTYKNVVGDEHEMYTCVCFTDNCNYPYTWKQFVDRGFTLAEQDVINM